MKKGRVFLVYLIDRLVSLEKANFSAKFKNRLFEYINKVFEEEAVDCYLTDMKDIGFFETFLLGTDKTKTITSETDKTMQVIKMSELKEKLMGYVPSQSRKMNEREELVKENIQLKKDEVIRILRQRGEIIKYLGRRIVVRDEHLYQRLERVYNHLFQATHPAESVTGEKTG